LQNIGKIEHEGVIIEVNSHSVFVRIVQQSACSDCHARGACSLSDAKVKVIEIPDSSGEYEVGGKVIITGDSSIGLRAVLYAFVIPLFIIIAVLALVLKHAGSETLAALITISIAALYYGILYFFREKLKNKFIFSLKRS